MVAYKYIIRSGLASAAAVAKCAKNTLICLACFLVDFFNYTIWRVLVNIYLLIICLCENLSTFVLKIFSNRKMNN